MAWWTAIYLITAITSVALIPRPAPAWEKRHAWPLRLAPVTSPLILILLQTCHAHTLKGVLQHFKPKGGNVPSKNPRPSMPSLIIWTLQLKNVQFFYRLHSVSNPAWKPADSIWLKINVRSRAAFQYTGLLQMHPRFPKIPTGSGLSYSRFWVFHQESEREGWLSRE